MKQINIWILVFVILISTSAITIAANENMNILPEVSSGSGGGSSGGSGGVLNPGDELSTGQSIYSQDGRFKLIMQTDGNLVLYGNVNAIWASGTYGSNFRAIMQNDGNFVVYDKNNNWQFATQTWDSPGARLIVQNDGTIALYDSNNKKLWWAPRPIPIDKKEDLGKFESGHRYYIHIYNIDDIARTYINGRLLTETKYQQDSGWIDITDYLSDGENKIEFKLDNGPVGWTYGFEIRQDESNIIWNDKCGYVASGSEPSIGCLNGDLTRGLVYRDIITFDYAGPKVLIDRLNPGESLSIGQYIISQNGRYKLIMQGDGNLVLYDLYTGKYLWATGTNGKPVSFAVMQYDGNFVLYDSKYNHYWDTKTFGHPGSWLLLQNDGKITMTLIIYGGSGGGGGY